MKTALVCGAGGFIGSHLVKRLKAEGYWVRGVDVKRPEFGETAADEFVEHDLRCEEGDRDGGADISRIVMVNPVRQLYPHQAPPFDEVYQLAADMGGMGFIESNECEIMRNNATINANVLHAAAEAGVKRYFFSSSVCVYRDMITGEPALSEADAYPANPDNEYGWEKLYAERMAMAYARKYDMQVRIARFQNCYGPEGTWEGGREKAPAAMCRKVAEASDGDAIEVWGDGSAVRSYTYIDDMLDGVRLIMASGLEGPVNIGSPEYVSVDALVRVVADVGEKTLSIEHIPGPTGVQSRDFRNSRIYLTGWMAKHSLVYGIAKTYPWVLAQVEAAAKKRRDNTEGICEH